MGIPSNAHGRIGNGPWSNFDGDLIAPDAMTLHSAPPESVLLIDEFGQSIPATEAGILTGSNTIGTPFPSAMVTSYNCSAWTSRSNSVSARLGRADWSIGTYRTSWNSASDSACSAASLLAAESTGRLYCFAAD